jgi:lysylphosphatidylglycerol synthetase-like protein (DUF2156 family)
LACYLGSAVVASAVGSTFTWDSSWADANPVTAGPWTALFSLGPAIGIAAIARVSASGVAVVSLVCAVAMLVMWDAFATSESSTAALAFLMGWFIGVPVSAALVLVSRAIGRRR